jgi:hypothetical protein
MEYRSAAGGASWTRVAGGAGVASFVLLIAAALIAPPLWDAPPTTARGAVVAAYAQHHRGATIAALFVYSLAIGLFLCFAAGLWAWVRRVEPDPPVLSAVFAFGAVALATLILASFVPVAINAYRAQTPAVAQALRDVTFGLLAVSGIPTAVCMGAYAELVLRLRRLPSWTAWLAALGAIAHVFIAGSFFTRTGFASLEGDVIVVVPGTFFTWILVTGIALARV